MNIRPTQPEGPQRSGADRTADRVSPKRGSSSDAAPSGGSPVDQVRISEDVRGIQGSQGAEAVPAGEMSPERMRQVLDRIQQRFYDRPEVVRDTLQQMAPALESDGDRS
ncbi:MAG: hypothetical protein ACRENS_04615 [Candidatus Eiseniibacteriota bacterium]